MPTILVMKKGISKNEFDIWSQILYSPVFDSWWRIKWQNPLILLGFCRFCMVKKMLYGNTTLKFFWFFYSVLLADSIFYQDQARLSHSGQYIFENWCRWTYSTYPRYLPHLYCLKFLSDCLLCNEYHTFPAFSPSVDKWAVKCNRSWNGQWYVHASDERPDVQRNLFLSRENSLRSYNGFMRSIVSLVLHKYNTIQQK